MLFLETIETATNVFMGQAMWLERRDSPGGPFGYYISNNNIWFNIFGTACAILSNALNDGLMMYRCFIIWNGSWHIIALPILVYLGATVMGVVSLVETALPNATFFAKQSTNFAIPWISLTTILNVSLTALISGRILYVAYKVRSSSISTSYTSVVAILVESSLPLSVLGVAFAVTLGKNFSPVVALSDIWGSFLAFSPQLIILRVAMGQAWTERTAPELTGSIEFAYPESRTILSQTDVGSHRIDLEKSQHSLTK